MTKLEIVYTAFHLWNVAADAAGRARDIKAEHPRAITSDSVVAVLLAATSTEAFINELGTRLSLSCRPDTPTLEVWGSLGACLEKLESQRATLKAKYLIASKLLPGGAFKKGAAPFQDFSLLIDVRNHFAHPKVQQELPAFIHDFSQRGFLYNRPRDNPKLAGWLFQLETPHIATWACRAARGIIWGVVQRLEFGTHPVISSIHEDMNFQWSKILSDSRVDP